MTFCHIPYSDDSAFLKHFFYFPSPLTGKVFFPCTKWKPLNLHILHDLCFRNTKSPCLVISFLLLLLMSIPQRACILISAAAAKSLQSCPTLWDPIDGSPAGSSVPGILQARILEWVAFPSPMHACMPSRFSHVPFCATLWTGFSVHRTLQARTLEWVAISFSIYMHTCRYMYTSV